MPSGKFINLRAKPFNDSDLLIDAISKEGEKWVFTAKNALKSKRRFSGGVLEPINFVEIFYTESKAGFFYIQEAKVIEGFPELRKNYQKLQWAFHFLKLISKGTREGLGDNRSLFDLLGNSLKTLQTTENPLHLKLHFEIKFLYYLGFLDLNEDSNEFVARPVSENHKIHLTDEEFNFIDQKTKALLRDMDLTLREDFETL